jgi:hypothetical protein
MRKHDAVDAVQIETLGFERHERGRATIDEHQSSPFRLKNRC